MIEKATPLFHYGFSSLNNYEDWRMADAMAQGMCRIQYLSGSTKSHPLKTKSQGVGIIINLNPWRIN